MKCDCVTENINISDESYANLVSYIDHQMETLVGPCSKGVFDKEPKDSYEGLYMAIGKAYVNQIFVDGIEAMVARRNKEIEAEGDGTDKSGM